MHIIDEFRSGIEVTPQMLRKVVQESVNGPTDEPVQSVTGSSVFINDEGIAVDAWDDPIFLEDVTDE